MDRTDPNYYAPATEKQIDYVAALARKAGYRFVGDAEKACFGKRKIGGLKRGQVSELLTFLGADK